jgi:soluble lytic murein transglycosylase
MAVCNSFSHRQPHAWYQSLCLLQVLVLSFATYAADDNPTTASLSPVTVLELQRSQFVEAQSALRKGQITNYKKYLEAIENYPLVPYLHYQELRRRLSRLPHSDVDSFLDSNQQTYLGDQLYRRWLDTLAENKRWHDYQTYYDPHGSNTTEIECNYLWARLQTGDREALDAVELLWNVGKSQPEVCDPLFRAWVAAGKLTPEITWQRYSKAVSARENSLALYLMKLMPNDLAKLAQLYQEVDNKPQVLDNQRRFREQSPYMHEIILHGLKRYARRQPLDAVTQWERYDAQHYFPSEGRAETLEYLIIQLAKNGHLQEAEAMLAQTNVVADDEVVAWLVRDALRDQDWKKVYQFIGLFPAKQQQSERWLYWRARAMEKLEIVDPEYPTPEQIYASLSLTRSFYGFLSADLIGREYTLLDRPINPPQDRIETVSMMPGMLRTLELFSLGSLRDARREWLYATSGLDSESMLAAGKIAEQRGWYRKGIEAVVDAQHWDDLQIRFPLAFQDEVQKAAKTTNIEPPLLFAIARQESAFASDAKSPAGAMGLMQLMPATARQTARHIGVTYDYWSLIDPQHNIQLGSTYLNQLLQEFDGNRVLAAAAYNAGPHRVKQWLKSNTEQIPYDIWIETIPFTETRGYVQNILSYSVIYGYRLGNLTPMLTESENKHPLFGNF